MPATEKNILLVEDSESDAYTTIRVLNKRVDRRFNVQHAACMIEAEAILGQQGKNIDIILLDLGLPDTGGKKDTFQRIEKIREDIPVIILTSVNDHELAVGMVEEGAQDYVRKSLISINPEVLWDAIDFAVCRHHNLGKLKEEKDKKLELKEKVIEWVTGSPGQLFEGGHQ